MSEHTKEPMAWAVMYTDSEYDYRIFADQEQAEAFALDRACEEHDSLAEIVPLHPLAAHVAAVERLREAAEKANETVYLVAAYLHEQGKKFYAEKLRETADTLAAALAAMEGK